MRLFSDINALPVFKNPVLTIGTFDGVHKGHKEILKSVVQHAHAINGESVLITFEPHPRKLLFPGQSLHLLTTLDEKLKLLEEEGITNTVVVPFTKSFSELSAQDYIKEFIVKRFRPHTIIIGYDHHFGHDRSGNIQLLQQLSKEYNFEVHEIPAHLIEAAAVSSTQIRNAVSEGHVRDAVVLLGRKYSISGKVVHGARLGRTIGYPTANIEVENADKLVPAIGIYAVQVLVSGILLNGMLSIGYNPTVTDTKDIKIEVNIFDFDRDIYEETIEIMFVHRLRDEQKFPSLEALVEQLKDDKEKALLVLEQPPQ